MRASPSECTARAAGVRCSPAPTAARAGPSVPCRPEPRRSTPWRVRERSRDQERLMTAIDPVTLVVVQNGLQQVASEMDLTFERAAFSPVISEGFDRSDGIYDRDTGDVIAQGELGLPILVGVMQFTTRAVVERAQSRAPGDMRLVTGPFCARARVRNVKMV